ncbi:zinc-dependent alcohol dehydrogenase family protein [Pseudaminobacter sp. 19-2017]|uniref:Zinc-dependent alcohol dehydrogenase family protein n=1 Tax=Pseudaminobacter soli (ex Zhang et al. 2022) TaxID=2831468 RepID=A0A942DWF3_9HYPH|nr:zinc-dependent alcohol dehydrogenase family protein [Pseudaminobacter soli]MBS3647857.1 zinc-dependent alcohol dehydrogenase family protein [Pseudaminobacter soli]
MRAVRFEGVGRIAVQELEKPAPGSGDLVVRVEASGICGTDRHILRGEFSSRPPVTLGHEFSGIVEAIGPGVTRFKVGHRVTGDPNIACGLCPSCRAGHVNLCESLEAIGVTRDGGLAEYVLVPEKQALSLPADLPPLYGAFCEPLACSIHGVDIAGLRPGMSAIVLGGGVIGMLVVQLARLAGATRTVMITRQAAKRQLAEQLGATASADPSAGDAVFDICGPGGLLSGGADVVFECAGVPDTVALAPKLARRGGAAVILGVLRPQDRVEIAPLELLLREVRLLTSFLNPFTHARAADLIATGAIDVAPLVTRQIGLEEAPGVISEPPPAGEIRAIVVP